MRPGFKSPFTIKKMRGSGGGEAQPNRMLKKSVLDFFSHDLAGVNPSNPYKLLDFSVS